MQDCCAEGYWIMATPNSQSLANTPSTRTNWRIHTRIRLIVFCWPRRWLRESHWSPTTANLHATLARYAKCELEQNSQRPISMGLSQRFRDQGFKKVAPKEQKQ